MVDSPGKKWEHDNVVKETFDYMRFSSAILLAVLVIAVVAILVVRSRTKPVRQPEETPSVDVDLPSAVQTVPDVADKPSRPAKPTERTKEEATGDSLETSTLVVNTTDGSAVPGAVDADAVEAEAVEEGRAWRPPKADAATMGAIREAFARWRSSGRGEDATADLRLALEGLSREATLEAAAAMMRAGSEQDRMDALWTVANAFGATGSEDLVRSNLYDDEDDGAALEFSNTLGPTRAGADEEAYREEEDRLAAETHDVVEIVSSGLEDSSAEVRAVAYETIATLSQERADVLYSQLLCSDSPVSADLRRQLMDELAGATDEGALTLFVQGMQSPDEATAAAAKANLEAMAGMEFKDIGDAVNWMEAREKAIVETEIDMGDDETLPDFDFENTPAGIIEGEKEP